MWRTIAAFGLLTLIFSKGFGLEAAEIIELKQAMLDRDVQGATDLFRRVIAPRVQAAAQRRGIVLEETEDDNGRLPG